MMWLGWPKERAPKTATRRDMAVCGEVAVLGQSLRCGLAQP